MKQLVIHLVSLFDQGHKVAVVLPLVQLLIAVYDVGKSREVVLVALQCPGEKP